MRQFRPLHDVYEEGRAARNLGTMRVDNPYDYDSLDLRIVWFKGFDNQDIVDRLSSIDYMTLRGE